MMKNLFLKDYKSYLIVILVLMAHIVHAQLDSTQKVSVKAFLTISPSHIFESGQSVFYLHGNVETYLSRRISLAADGYYFLNESSDKSLFDYNHSAFFGASFHMWRKNNDFYIGIQPGLSFTRVDQQFSADGNTKPSVNPLASTVVGYNFFVNRVFHFFLQSRLVFGQHNYDVHMNLTDIRFSAGLGFNFAKKSGAQ